MNRLPSIAFVLVCASALVNAAAQDNPGWPVFRGDATGTGVSPAVGASFVPDAKRIEKAIADLSSADEAVVLKARVYLKRCGSFVKPRLETEMLKGGIPTATTPAATSAPQTAPAAPQTKSAAACKAIVDSLDKAEILWKLPCEQFFTGSPAFDDKAVYAGDRGGNLYAADKVTGKQLWKVALPAPTNCSPALRGDSLFIACHDGSVVRVSKAGGAIVWTYKPDALAQLASKPATASAPASHEAAQPPFVWDGVAADDKNVYFGLSDGRALAVSLDKGEKVWEFPPEKVVVEGKVLESGFYGVPAVADGKVYLGSTNRKLYALDAATGKKAWEYPASDAIRRSPAVSKTVVLVVAGKELTAVNKANGKKKWSFVSERTWRSYPTVYGEFVVAAGDFGRTYVFKAETGEQVWSGNLPDAVDGALAVVNDRIYFVSSGMTLGCVNFRSAGRVWSFSTPAGGGVKATSPAVDNGIIYMTTHKTERVNNPDEVAVSNCILAIAEPSDDLYGLNPLPVAWKLAEVNRRVLARHAKPYAMLKGEQGFFQPETLVFSDPRTGSEIVKFSDDPSANYHHGMINRPSYNADGSRLVLHSGRAYNPGRYILNADGSHFRRIDLENFLLNYGIDPCWDRKQPNIVYTNDKAAVYAVDVDSLRTTKVCDLPDPDKAKGIFSYPSADNSLLLLLSGPKVYLARTDGKGVTTINLPNPKAKELAPEHDSKWEPQGAHDIFFLLGEDNTISFNYGPTASVGEGIFYEMSPKGDLLRVIYPFRVPGGSDPIYYSHPGWRQDGKKVAYFGYGGPKMGWGFFLRDRDGANPVKLCEENIGGHCGWDNYDDEWVFASPSVGKGGFAGTISRFRTDGSLTGQILCDARPETEPNSSYSAIPRVAPSPDGTKAVFSSSMMGNAGLIDMYSVTVKRPDPPVKVAVTGSNITWEAPRLAREIMGYNVYRSADGKSWRRMTPDPVKEKVFPASGDGLYAVTSVEPSGLESLAVGGVAVVGPVKPLFLLDAEYSEYAAPIKELRDMKAANWFALQDSGKGGSSAKMKFESPVEGGGFSVFARVKGGAWGIKVNDDDLGTAEWSKDEWTWVKLPKLAAVKKGANVLVMTSVASDAAIDKVVIAPDGDWQPKDTMYLIQTPPGEVRDCYAQRLDRTLVRLAWTDPQVNAPRYCNIYYAAGEANPAIDQTCRIASMPRGTLQYIDFASKPGAAGRYAVTAVDSFGNESKPVFTAVPPAAK